MKIKNTDLGGFAAILIGGFIIGKDYEANDYTSTDFFMIMALLALGFYLAVVLS